MSETRRLESPASVERESRTDALLVEGLDQYFAGNYENAIHLWTRVLFLDRSHARARAYISRARTALGEHQRRAEEMAHEAEALIAAGHLSRARAALSSLGRAAGAEEKVAELWTRLERAERAGVGKRPEVPARASAIVDAVPLRTWRRSVLAAARLAAAGAFGTLVVTAAASPAVRGWLTGAHDAPATAPVARSRPLPVLSASDVALVRARSLYAQGRLSEALSALERIDVASVNREAADALRIEIQQWLLMPRRHMTTAEE